MKKFYDKKCGCGTRVDKNRVPDLYEKYGSRSQIKSALTKQYIYIFSSDKIFIKPLRGVIRKNHQVACFVSSIRPIQLEILKCLPEISSFIKYNRQHIYKRGFSNVILKIVGGSCSISSATVVLVKIIQNITVLVIECYLFLIDLKDVKAVYISVFGPLFQVDFRNDPLMDEICTVAIFLEFF